MFTKINKEHSMTLEKLIKRIKTNEAELTTIHYNDYQTAENAYAPLHKTDLVLLTEALAENHSVIYIEMAFDNLDKEEATALANLLNKNHRITSLFLNYEEATLEGERILTEAIEKNRSITWLGFEGSEFSDLEIQKRLLGHITENQKLAAQLREAAKAGNFDLVVQLVEEGASLNDEDTGDWGNTALHLASSAPLRILNFDKSSLICEQFIKITEYLLNHDNQVVLRNSSSEYPYLNILPQSEIPQKYANLTFFKPKPSANYLDDYDSFMKYSVSVYNSTRI